jgi:uncharacterized GH25 family protein
MKIGEKMKKTLAALIITLLFTVQVSAHTTVIFPQKTKDGEQHLMVVHFMPWYGDNIMGIRLHEEDTDHLKGLESISLIHNGEEKDISKQAVPLFYKVRNNNRECYSIPVKRKMVSRAGDYIFVVRHIPHWRKNKDMYIKKISKFFLNNGGLITDWPHRVLQDAPEIIPLSAPDSVHTGTIFRAEVVNDKGENIPHAKIHVEFLNYKTGDKGIDTSAPLLKDREIGETFLFTDNSGAFSFVPPREGIWTFTLVDGDKDIMINGKQLRYDSSMSLKVR